MEEFLETTSPYVDALPQITAEYINYDHNEGSYRLLQLIGEGGHCHVYRVGDFAYKDVCDVKEIEFLIRAGDCAVQPVARVKGDKIEHTGGCLMELAERLPSFSKIPEHEKPALKDEMIQLLDNLHKKYNIVHGNVKAAQILRCKDGKLRFCGMDGSRHFNEQCKVWRRREPIFHLSPNRGLSVRNAFNDKGYPGPEPFDDWYALALTIWCLYTGNDVVFDFRTNIDHVWEQRASVDVAQVKDEETREWIWKILKEGGAIKVYEPPQSDQPDYESSEESD